MLCLVNHSFSKIVYCSFSIFIQNGRTICEIDVRCVERILEKKVYRCGAPIRKCINVSKNICFKKFVKSKKYNLRIFFLEIYFWKFGPASSTTSIRLYCTNPHCNKSIRLVSVQQENVRDENTVINNIKQLNSIISLPLTLLFLFFHLLIIRFIF